MKGIKELPSDCVEATIQLVEVLHPNLSWTAVISLNDNVATKHAGEPLPVEELIQAQQNDDHIEPFLQLKLSDKNPTGHLCKCIMCSWDKLFLGDDGVLHRRMNTQTQLVLPAKYKQRILRELHNNMGHQGLDRTMSSEKGSIGHKCTMMLIIMSPRVVFT